MKKNDMYKYCCILLLVFNLYIMFMYVSNRQSCNKGIAAYSDEDLHNLSQEIVYKNMYSVLNFLITEYYKGNYYFLHEIDYVYRDSGLNKHILYDKFGLIEKMYFENLYIPDTINNLIIELNDLFIQQRLGVAKNEILYFFSQNPAPPLDTGVFVYDDLFSGYIIVDTIPKFNNLKYYIFLSEKLGVEREKCKAPFIAYIDVCKDGSLRPILYLKTGGIIDSLFLDIVNKIPKNHVTPAFYDGRKVNHRVMYSI